MSKLREEFNEYRSKMNEKILNCGFNDYKKIFAIDHKTYLDGALPAKTKELMGLTASLVLRCNDCVFYHIEKAIEAGATKEELFETFQVALVVGGTIVIPHMRKGFEYMEECFNN
ncbi:MAG: carboxymuconolactone decarboxylase family protein [Ignavibacteriaceae bacterium]|nr:carboxymuconolactone decarboxylase family protein [Ignavibacteriaceae bacterium]